MPAQIILTMAFTQITDIWRPGRSLEDHLKHLQLYPSFGPLEPKISPMLEIQYIFLFPYLSLCTMFIPTGIVHKLNQCNSFRYEPILF